MLGNPVLYEQVIGACLISTAAVIWLGAEALTESAEPKSAGQIQLFSGFITFILCFFVIFVLKKPIVAPPAIAFSIGQMSFGFHNYSGLDISGLGHMSIVFAVAVWWWGVYMAQLGQWIYAILGFDWGLIFASLIPLCIFGRGMRWNIWVLRISTYAFLLVPAMLILTGHSLFI